ncbi:hypothetical protein FRB90_000140 [Tulasnella sp. 427]|nr:hypothetical protein FRB90_000140 [Tulasnella sp. 427]
MSSGTNDFSELITRFNQTLSTLKGNTDTNDPSRSLWDDVRWEELIASATSTISLFGALNLIGASAESDFDLDVPTNGGNKQFKYINSVSYRATVFQLQMAGLAAFSQSRDNLSMLAARFGEIKDVATALRDILPQSNSNGEGNPQLSWEHVSRITMLEQYRDVYTKSSALLKESSDQFSELLGLAMEMIVQTASTQASFEKRKEEIERRRTFCEIALRTLNESKPKAEKEKTDESLWNLIDEGLFAQPRSTVKQVMEEFSPTRAKQRAEEQHRASYKILDAIADIGFLEKSSHKPNDGTPQSAHSDKPIAKAVSPNTSPTPLTDARKEARIRSGKMVLAHTDPFLAELVALQDEEIKLQHIGRIPGETLSVLTSLLSPLEHLKRFFRLLSESVDVRMRVSLESLGRIAQNVKANRNSVSLFAIAVLNRECTTISQLAQAVSKIANTYVTLHDKHIQSGTTLLRQLPTTLKDVHNSPNAMRAMNTEIDMLHEWASRAQQDMLSLMRKELQDFDAATSAQVEAKVHATFPASGGPVLDSAVAVRPVVSECEEEVVAIPQ